MLDKLLHSAARQDPFFSYCYGVRLWQMDLDWLNGYLGDTVSPSPPPLANIIWPDINPAGEAWRKYFNLCRQHKNFYLHKIFLPLSWDHTFLKLNLDIECFSFLSAQVWLYLGQDCIWKILNNTNIRKVSEGLKCFRLKF